MSEVQGPGYHEWSSFLVDLKAELAEADGAPASCAEAGEAPPTGSAPHQAQPAARARTLRRAAVLLHALTLVLATVVPAALGPADRPPRDELAPSARLDEQEAIEDQLGLSFVSVVPTPTDGWVGRVFERFERRVAGLDELARLHLARALVDEAELAGVDPLLVLAVIQVESAYDVAALSDAGAVGLMQLLPPTLREEAERAGVDGTNPRDPEINLRMGIRYLRRMLDQFGRQDHALMAYNAGPNRILGYMRGEGIPERFWEYPRRVRAEQRRLRQAYPELQLPSRLAVR